MTPIPLTDADHAALTGARPRHCGDLVEGPWRAWICRFDGHADPVVSVWSLEPFALGQHCWFPGASPAAVRAWVASLPAPGARAADRDGVVRPAALSAPTPAKTRRPARTVPSTAAGVNGAVAG